MFTSNEERGIFIAPGAQVVGDVTLADDVSVWHNAVIRGDEGAISVGRGSCVQDCSVLHARTVVGEDVTIGHAAIVHGCTVGDRTLIGMGTTILTGARIGHDCLIGAGSLVTGKMDIPPRSLVMGSPARVVRELTDEEVASNLHNAHEYVELAHQHMRGEFS